MKHTITVKNLATGLIWLLVSTLGSIAGLSAQTLTGEALYKQGRFLDARVVFNARITANPKDAAAYYWIGRSRWHEDKWDDAVSYFRKAVAADPQNAEYHFWISRALGDKMRRVSIFEAMGSLDEFKKEGQEAIRLNPENLDYRQLWLIYNANAPGIAGGNKDEAWKQVGEIAKRDQLYANRMEAMFYDGAGDFDKKGIPAFRKAVDAQPLTPRNWGVFANAYAAKDRTKEAIDILKEGWEKSKHAPQILWYLGRISAEKKQNLDEGVNWLKQYIDAPWDIEFPSRPEAWFYIGELHKAAGRKAEAKLAYQNALAILPEFVRALDGLKSL